MAACADTLPPTDLPSDAPGYITHANYSRQASTALESDVFLSDCELGINHPMNSESSDTEVEGPSTKMLPRSTSDYLLQPSELEEKLQSYRILSAGGKKLCEITDESSAGRQTPESLSGGQRSTTPSGVCTSGADLERGVRRDHTNSEDRSGFWGGLMACLQPMVVFLKKDQVPQAKKDPWEIPFADIRELDFIGSGSQGAVFVGEYRGEKIAVKKVKDPSYCDGIRHLRKLSHPNIVKFK